MAIIFCGWLLRLPDTIDGRLEVARISSALLASTATRRAIKAMRAGVRKESRIALSLERKEGAKLGGQQLSRRGNGGHCHQGEGREDDG